jgi:ABC-type branched-subunit amino acid transport system ATPase component
MTQSDRAAMPALPVLTGAGLVKSYGRTTVLHQASLEVDRGESVAVMGPSGSGKSTLLYCLSGVVTPERGDVVFSGVRVNALSDARRAELRRSDFGFVFQFPGLLPELSADENVALPLMLAGVRRRDAVTRARELFPALVIGTIARILDQRETLIALRLAGTPPTMLLAAQRREMLPPTILLGGIAAIAGLASGSTLGSASLLNPYSAGIFAGLLALGAIALMLADRTSQPVLERTSADLSERE